MTTVKTESEIIISISWTYFNTQISSTNNVLDLAGDKHGFELCRKIRCPVGYVQIPQGQNQHHPQQSKTES